MMNYCPSKIMNRKAYYNKKKRCIFDDHMPRLMSKDMYSKINSIEDFSLVNHKEYPVSEER